METMTVPTTDQRIDDLRSETRQGFAQVGHRFDRVEGDISEIRADIRDLRNEMKAGDEGLRAEINALDNSLRAEIKAGDDALRTEIRALGQNIEDLRTLMIRFFAGTLGSVVAGVVVAVLGAHFWG